MYSGSFIFTVFNLFPDILWMYYMVRLYSKLNIAPTFFLYNMKTLWLTHNIPTYVQKNGITFSWHVDI